MALATSLDKIYKRFFSKITDDMYLFITEQETKNQAFDLFENAIWDFESPRFDISDYTEDGYSFDITLEEINIISSLMVLEWLNLQVNNCEIIRMKYTGPEFKMSSQANHLSKVKEWIKLYEKKCDNLHISYHKRIISKEGAVSLLGTIVGRE